MQYLRRKFSENYVDPQPDAQKSFKSFSALKKFRRKDGLEV